MPTRPAGPGAAGPDGRAVDWQRPGVAAFAPTVPCGPACLAGGRWGSSRGPGIDLRWICDIPLMDLGSPDAAAAVPTRLRPGSSRYPESAELGLSQPGGGSSPLGHRLGASAPMTHGDYARGAVSLVPGTRDL
jgi:hypothetical protein